MKKAMLLPMFLLFLLIFSAKARADTYISGCSNLNESGTYYLTSDIIDSEDSICINIEADNIVLDCQGHIIDGTSESYTYGIYVYRDSIENTNITIRNCSISEWYYGIYLVQSNNNILYNFISNENLGTGIYLYLSDNNIFYNFTSNSNVYGIFLDELSNNNTFYNFTSKENSDSGVYLTFSSNNTFFDFILENNYYGINLDGLSNNNTFYNFTSKENSDAGIYLAHTYNNTFFDFILENNYYGIHLEDSPNNNTFYNFISNENSDGIYLERYSNNNIFYNFTSNNNDNYGIQLFYSSSNNTFYNFTSNYNGNGGIYLHDYSSNNILYNFISNSNNKGIILSSFSSNNILYNFISNENLDTGIYLHLSDNNIFYNFTSNSNVYGIRLLESSKNNIFYNFRLMYNNYGVSLYEYEEGYYIKDNIFYNGLFNNTVNFYFYSTNNFSVNYWNTTKQSGQRIYSFGAEIGGNYWTNPSGSGYSDTCDDSDKDGFCDESYVLYENNIDYLPLTNVIECNDGEYRCNNNNVEVCIDGQWVFYQECEYRCYEGECIEKPKPFYNVITSLVLSLIPLIISISFILIPLGKILTEGVSAENIIAIVLAIIIGLAFLVIIVNSIS